MQAGGLLRGPPGYRAASPWSPMVATFATVAIIGLSILLTVVVLGVSGRATGTDGAFMLMALGLGQLITIVLTLLASLLGGGRPWDVLALRAPRMGGHVYVSALLLLVLLQAVTGAVLYHVKTEDMFADLRPFVDLAGGPQWPLAMLVVAVGAPLSEELLMRGFLLSALAQSRLGFAGAALVTSAVWTALHAGYSAVGIVEVFLIGLFFSWLLWRTGSLWVAIFCHAVYNGTILLVLRYVPLPA